MELRHLRYFVAVAETGSFTVAAERRLHTSQPSLSRQIKDLEDQVGVDLLVRSARGVTLTEAGKVFFNYARMALSQVDAGIDAARRAAQPDKQRFAMGFLTGQEMTWLPEAMRLLRAELPNIDVTVSSDYSPDLAEAVARGKLDVAFLRAEPDYDLVYRPVKQEPLVVLMPSDHPLTSQSRIHPKDLVGEPFIGMGSKATVLRAVIDAYLEKAGVAMTPGQVVDNPAMVMSLVASTRGVTLIPAYVQSLMPWSVVSRPLAGKVPTIGLVIGYSKSNRSPMLKMFLSQVDELITRVSNAGLSD
ncbi:LysR substrate-binding domain-containing protein [Dyella caseinilytica]|uniref:LysR family transcriptional regulator n=1 Tax=Dyella caseinilytica TaxID=1849581 RepID=A0ABX7H0D0_9GAMM|nr:LysR substrate-binding domain-containing protein [Dyella caseinilytica]QRN55666.1 LysR family transcriptional regulator [Dyella caseinilytica]GGA03545.1 transcriptional regulator [Dyella caseinilytica]